MGAGGLRVAARRGRHAQSQLGPRVAGFALQRVAEDRLGLVQLAALQQRLGQLQRHGRRVVRPGVGGALRRLAQQRHGGVRVALQGDHGAGVGPARVGRVEPGGLREAAVGVAVEQVGQQHHPQPAPGAGRAAVFQHLVPRPLDHVADLGFLDAGRQRRRLRRGGGAIPPPADGRAAGQRGHGEAEQHPARRGASSWRRFLPLCELHDPIGRPAVELLRAAVRPRHFDGIDLRRLAQPEHGQRRVAAQVALRGVDEPQLHPAAGPDAHLGAVGVAVMLRIDGPHLEPVAAIRRDVAEQPRAGRRWWSPAGPAAPSPSKSPQARPRPTFQAPQNALFAGDTSRNLPAPSLANSWLRSA